MDLTGYKPLFDRDEEDRRAASGIPDYSRIQLAKPPEPPGAFERVDKAITGVLGTNVPPPESVDAGGVADQAAAAEAQQARIGLRRAELVDPNRGEIRRKFDATAAGLAGAVGGPAEWIGRKTGLTALEQFGQAAQEDAAALMPENATFGDKLANAIGSTLGFLPLGGAAGLGLRAVGAARSVAGTGAAAVASIAETLGNAQQAYEDALKHTGNPTWAEEQGWKTAIAMLPINFLTDKIGLFGRSGVKEAERAAAKAIAGGASKEAAERAAVLAYKAANKPIRDVGVAMGAEAFQEGSQQLGANYFGHNPIGEGVAESAVLGGLVGGIFKGGQKLLEPKVETPPEPAAPPPPPPEPLALPSPDSPMPGAPVTVGADGTAVPMTYREYQQQSATRDLGIPSQVSSPASVPLSPNLGEDTATPDVPPTPVGLPLEADAAHAVANDARNNGQQTMVLPHPDAPGKFMVVPSTQPATEPPPPQTTFPALPAPTSPFPGGIMRSDAAGGARPETYQEALQTAEQRRTAEALGTPVITQPGASSEAGGAVPPAPPGAPDVIQPGSSTVGVPPHIAHRLAGEARDRGEQVTVQPHPTSPGAFVVQRVDQPAGELPAHGPERGVNPPKPGPVMPTDKVKADGTPYKTKSGAAVALKAAGLGKTHAVTQVEGGYTLRPLEAKSAAAPAASGVQVPRATPAWATDYSAHSGVKVGTNNRNPRASLLYGNVRNLPSYNKTIFALRESFVSDNGERDVVTAAINDLLRLGMPSSMLSNITAIGSHDGGNLAQFNTTSRSISIRSDVLYDVRQGGEAAAIALRSFLAHEFAHAADLMTPNDAISAQELGFGIQPDGNGYLTPGNLSHEIAEHWVNGGEFASYFDYPLAKSFDSWGLSTELFAQSTALYFTNPDKMAAQLPLNFAAMEAIYGTKKGGNAGVRVGSPGSREAIRAALQQESPGRSAEGIQPRRVAGADQRRAEVEQAGRGVGVDVGVGPDADVALGRADALPKGRYVAAPRITGTGAVIGAPPGKGSVADAKALVRSVMKMLDHPFALAEQSYDWYEKSGAEVMRLARGDRTLAEKTIRLLALYSQGNQIGGNVTATIKSMVQLAAGKPAKAGRFPNVTAKVVGPLLAAPELSLEVKGVNDKVLNFYRNLYDGTFNERKYEGASTQDRWMMRLFGYSFANDQDVGGGSSLSATQYAYASYITDRVAEDYAKKFGHDMLPHQVQAVLWTYKKNTDAALAHGTEVAAAKRVIKSSKAITEDVVKAKKRLKELGEFTPTTSNFVDYFRRQTALVTWETIPGAGAPWLKTDEAQREFTRAARQVLLTPDGRDKLIEMLGLSPLYSDEYSVGTYENALHPNVLTGVTLLGGGSPATKMVDVYASALGYIYRQKAMAWHRPDPTMPKGQTKLGVSVTYDDTTDFDQSLYDHLRDVVPGADFTKIGDREYRFLHFPEFSGMKDAEFVQKITAAIEAYNTGLHAEVGTFRAQTGWIEGGQDGQDYIPRIAAAGAPGLQGWLDSRRAEVDRLVAEYSDRPVGVDSTAAEAGGLSDRGPVARSARPVERERGAIAVNGERLRGAPEGVEVPGRGRVEIRPNLTARQTAANYMAKAGLPYNPPTTFARVDTARAKRIADAFDAMPHAPNDPDVKAAYAAMIDETLAQWRAIKKTGLKVEFITGADPYAASPRLAILDVLENNHLWVFPTESGFGVSAADVSSNPLLAPTTEKIGGRVLLANDVFRIVHDYFGHIKDGNGFRADGEENAWRSHSAMYSPLARRAMTTETRGQNSWVNYGPYGAQNRSASGSETHYADQKTGLLPEWVVEEGAGDAPRLNRVPADEALDYGHKGTGENASGIRAMGDIERRYAMGVQPDGRGGYVIQDMRSGGTSEPYKTYDEARAAIPALREAGGVPPRRSFNQPFQPGIAGPETGTAISRQALQAIVDRVMAKWPGAPRIIIENAPDRAYSAEIPSDSVGAYDGRTVTLYAKNLKTDRQALTTLAHEIVGHHSVEEMLGPERFAQLVKAIQTARAAGNKAVLELAQSVRETHGDLDPNEQAAEIVARAAERAVDADGNIRPGFAWFKRMLSHVAEFLRSRGIGVAFTNAELAGLLSRAERRLSEEGGVVTPATAYTNRQSPIFYSALTRALAAHPQGRGDAGQWMGIIRSLKGVKPDEVKWSGVEPWLNAQKGPIARQALVDYLNANNVQVTETELGADNSDVGAWWNDEGGANEETPFEELTDAERRDAEERYRDEVGQYEEGATKFQSYTLPGGENYRELLLTLPQKPVPQIQQIAGGRWTVYADDNTPINGSWGTRKEAEDVLADMRGRDAAYGYRSKYSGVEPPQFASAHFDQANILAHIRFDERTDAQGRRVLHIAEIQSDWAQKGRKQGFAQDLSEAEDAFQAYREDLEKRYAAAIRKEFENEASDPVRLDRQVAAFVRNSNDASRASYFDEKAKYNELARAADGEAEATFKGVPRAPYVTTRKFGVFVDGQERVVKSNKPDVPDQTPRFNTMAEAQAAAKKVGGEARDLGDMDNTPAWSMLAMRRMIRYASENGFEAVTWDVGATQQDRYDLSKVIDTLKVARNEDGTWWLRGGKHAEDEAVIYENNIPEDKLDDYVGKELADRIVRDMAGAVPVPSPKKLFQVLGAFPAVGFATRAEAQERIDAFTSTNIEAVNEQIAKFPLSIGEYTEPPPRDGRESLRQRRGVVSDENDPYRIYSGVDLKTGGEGMLGFYDEILPKEVNKYVKQWGAKVEPMDVVAGQDYEAGAARRKREFGAPATPKLAPAHSLTITPAMRESAMQGVPLFNRAGSGETFVINQNHNNGTIEELFRTSDREAAKKKIRALLSNDPEGRYSLKVEPTEKPRLNRAPDWVTSGSPDLQSAAAKIDTYAPGDTIKVKVAKLTQNWKLRLQQGLVDSFAALKDLGDEQYLLARMTKGAIGALEGALLYGIPKLDRNGAIYGELDHKGFLGAMKELSGEHDRFFMWVAGNRANRLMGEGKERLWTQPEITAMRALNTGTMKDGSSRQQAYDAALTTLTRYNKAIMDIAEKTGLIDAESRATWEHGFYVPFYRMMEDDRISGPTKVKGLVRQYAFKKLKGGEQSVGDLMANTLQNWSHLLSASLANQAAVSALQKAEQMGVASRATAETKGATFAMEGGQKAYYEVHDPFVLQAISALDQAGFKGIAAEWMTGLKRVLTMGVTVSPTFKIRNLMRDTLSAMAQTNTSYNLLENMRQGFAGTSKKSDDYAQMLFGGGLMRFGTIIEGEHAQHAKRLIKSGIRDQTILDTTTKIRDAMGKVWDAYQDFGDRMENINRAALYKKLRSEGKSHLEAAYQARDMMDFGLQGSWVAMRFLAQTVPFLNARAQGIYKLGRSAKGDPQRFLAVTGAVSLASMMLLLAYADDDDWKQREDWDRDTYWWFKIGGTAYRIPKPFEVGAVGTIAERSLELLVNNEFTGKDFAKRMMFMLGQTFAFNPMPQAFKPAIDLYANTDSFTGRDIETRGMEALSKSERIGPNTSLLAQALGSAGDYTGVSPVQIDFLLRAYLGWMGTHAALAADSLAQPFRKGEQPAGKIDDVFLVGDFVKSLPQPQSRYTTEFYDQAKKVSEVMANIRHYRQLGDTDKVRSIIEDNRDKISLSPMYTSTERQLSAIGQMVKKIRANTELSATEKRERLDELAQRRNQLVKGVSQRIRERAAAE